MPDILSDGIETGAIVQASKGPVFEGDGKTEEVWESPSYEKTQAVIRKVEETLGQKFPGNEREIGCVLDLYFGAYRLEKWALRPDSLGDTEEDKLQKTLAARIQHNQAHSIFYASSKDADGEYVDEIYKVVKNFENIRKYLGNDSISKYWVAIKSELAIVRALHTAGYKVHLPDYEEDPYETSLEGNETYQWDVKNGVDGVAVSDSGEVLLLNFKGERFYSDVRKGELRSTVDVDPDSFDVNSLPDSLKKIIQSNKPNLTRKLTITVPTAGMSLGAFRSFEKTTGGKKDALVRFGRLMPELENHLIERLSPAYKTADRKVTY